MRVSPQLVVGVLCGGLAGSVLTWWVNRPKLTEVTYSVSTTTVGTDATVKNLIPELRLQIAGEDIPVVYTHAVEFKTNDGPYLESAEVAITFPKPVRIFGMTAESPSALHRISCSQLTEGTRCTMSPVSVNPPNAYRVTIATNQKQASSVITVTKGLVLSRIEDVLARQSRIGRIFWNSLDPLVLALLCLLAASMYYLRKEYRLLIGMHRNELDRLLKENTELQRASLGMPKRDPS